MLSYSKGIYIKDDLLQYFNIILKVKTKNLQRTTQTVEPVEPFFMNNLVITVTFSGSKKRHSVIFIS